MKKFNLCKSNSCYEISSSLKDRDEAEALSKELSLSSSWHIASHSGKGANGETYDYLRIRVGIRSVSASELDRLYKLAEQQDVWTPPTPEEIEKDRLKAEEWRKIRGDHPKKTVKAHEETDRNPFEREIVRARTTHAPIDECERPGCPIVKLTKMSTGEPVSEIHHAYGVAEDDTESTMFRLCGFCHLPITRGAMEADIWNQELLDMAAGKLPPRQSGQQFTTWTPLAPIPVVESIPESNTAPESVAAQEIPIMALMPTVEYNGPKMRFNVCDLNAIETRVGAWLSGCIDLMRVFEPQPGLPNGRDPYIDFASKIFGIPYDVIYNDYKEKNGKERKNLAKRMRQLAKPGVLGAIYRLSGGTWGHALKGHKDHGDDCNAKELKKNGKKVGKKDCICPTIHDKIKTGLWGYADNMGVEMEEKQANEIVNVFRNSYPEIPAMWNTLEDAVADVMHGVSTIRKVGPNGCVEIGKINILNPQTKQIDSSIMYMQLPSGRRLHYLDARMEPTKMPWKDRNGQDVWRDSLVYAGLNQDTKQWGRIQTHGGKLFENLVQGIARDVLAVKLLLFEENEMPVVGHVHDEGICIVPDDPFSPGVDLMVKIMSESIFWAPGLLLGADGFEDSIYHK